MAYPLQIFEPTSTCVVYGSHEHVSMSAKCCRYYWLEHYVVKSSLKPTLLTTSHDRTDAKFCDTLRLNTLPEFLGIPLKADEMMIELSKRAYNLYHVTKLLHKVNGKLVHYRSRIESRPRIPHLDGGEY